MGQRSAPFVDNHKTVTTFRAGRQEHIHQPTRVNRERAVLVSPAPAPAGLPAHLLPWALVHLCPLELGKQALKKKKKKSYKRHGPGLGSGRSCRGLNPPQAGIGGSRTAQGSPVTWGGLGPGGQVPEGKLVEGCVGGRRKWRHVYFSSGPVVLLAPTGLRYRPGSRRKPRGGRPGRGSPVPSPRAPCLRRRRRRRPPAPLTR